MNSTVTPTNARDARLKKRRTVGASVLSGAVLLGMFSMTTASMAFAAEANLNLGTADTYSVLSGQSITNTGETFLEGDMGVDPGTSITGFRAGQVLGATHTADAESSLAKDDLTKAYDDAAGRAPNEIIAGDLAGKTLVGGVYKSNSSLDLTGTVTLDAEGDPSTVWVFQVGSTLTTGSASKVALTNGASACNVYWQVGSSATLGTASDFKGSILALTSISATTDATIEGRALARNGSVTLDTNVIRNPICSTGVPAPTPTDTATVTPSPTATPTDTATPAPTDTATVTPAPTDTTTPSASPTASVTVTPSVSPSTVVPSESGTPGPTGAVAPGGPDTGESGKLDGGALLDSANNNVNGETDTAANLRTVSDKKLAATGAGPITQLTGVAAVLALIGGAFLVFSSRVNRTAHKH